MNTLDCLQKILRYECNSKWMSNFGAFYAGGEVYCIRLIAICYVSILLLDVYHENHFVQELWQPQRFHYQTGIDYDIHDPYTDAFNKQLVASYATANGGMGAAHPSAKENLAII
jgi:hypothetical protein